jgi:basic membrane lipoprotein Med (substrate-binding protein (PBP1-ABC) superfamily)
MSDQSELAPKTVVTSVVWDMWPTVRQVIGQVKAGVFTSQDFGQFSYMGKGGSYLAPYDAWDNKLPAEVKTMVAKRTQEIKDGTFRVPVDESTPQSQ